jgi:acetolactate synthase-1/2/3 large subunit
MGYGVPAAMGAKVALGDAQTICISGDGSFQMNLQELGTIAQYNIDIKTVIINNGWQGMVRQWQQTFFGERYSASNMELGMPNIEMLCRAYGMKGIVVESREELPNAIAQMLAHDGPVVVDVRVSKDENCYPMVAPGKSNAQMLGVPERKKLENAAEVMNCPSCGAKNAASNHFCPECGTKL